MSDLGERLDRLGLSQYLEVLVAEGFDTWETVLDITESDLNSLGFKLGHRRKLQRSIANTRGQSVDRTLLIKSTSGDGSYRSDDSAQDIKAQTGVPPASRPAGTNAKRKYRRHPKADDKAPERPPSAYVIFSNQVRESLKGQELSFTEIAKVVGEKWQVLPADAREACERQASAAKERYYAELAEYKKTPQYGSHQKYLEDFKAKQAAQSKEGKRYKVDTDTSASTSGTMSRSNDQVQHLATRRVNTVQPDAFAVGHQSPPIGPIRLPSTQSFPSNSTSPAVHPLSGVSSPGMGDHFSSVSTSPSSAPVLKGTPTEMNASAMARDAMGQSDPSGPYPLATYGFFHQQPSSTTPPATYGSLQAPVDLPCRRQFREPARLPPLTHEDTTMSSVSSISTNSGEGGYNTVTYPAPYLPVMDAQKSNRVLPHPIPSLGATPSPLNRPTLPALSPKVHSDFRTNFSLAALVRAGELAREANDEETERESIS